MNGSGGTFDNSELGSVSVLYIKVKGRSKKYSVDYSSLDVSSCISILRRYL